MPSIVRVAVDFDLFSILQSSQAPLSTAEIAQQCGADRLLISRLLRMLASAGFVTETHVEMWSGTAIAAAMTVPAVAAGVRFTFDILGKSAISAADYFRGKGRESPEEPTDGLFNFAFRTKYSAFDYMVREAPEQLRDFNLFMGAVMGTRQYYYDWYPIEEKLITGAEVAPGGVFLVDVGGGKGHDIQALAERRPNLPGRLILQDLTNALNSIKAGSLDHRIEVQEQDFFTPNAVQGARVYLLHQILHDWSDKYCLEILKHLRDAMKSGYSRLLIHDLILPDQNASAHHAGFDIAMMVKKLLPNCELC